LHTVEAKTLEQKRKCPICSRKMLKKAIGEQPEVLIDVCQYGDGLWFDGGELTQTITQLAAKPSEKQDTPQRVVSFLGDVFKF
jgi:Zn-finger nucleic acid-binding protein